MKGTNIALTSAAMILGSTAYAADLCEGYGPQAPRDIASKAGANTLPYSIAPDPLVMNLCDIHLHRNAEHKGPGFSVSGGDGEHGGWKCNQTDALSEAELIDPFDGEGPLKGVTTGDTIEVHWVYTTCAAQPGPTLNSCFTEACINPQLRVEAQAFLVVNDPQALDFSNFDYKGHVVNGMHQPAGMPANTGNPAVYAGSTTGPSYTEQECSPYQGTWSVRPQCATIDISSLHKWVADGNVFDEHHAHGVRQIVRSEPLLSPIK